MVGRAHSFDIQTRFLKFDELKKSQGAYMTSLAFLYIMQAHPLHFQALFWKSACE